MVFKALLFITVSILVQFGSLIASTTAQRHKKGGFKMGSIIFAGMGRKAQEISLSNNPNYQSQVEAMIKVFGAPEHEDKIAIQKEMRERKEKQDATNKGFNDLPIFDKDSQNIQQLNLFKIE
jgi:hypothetical protein